ncbi:flagellar basal body-associated FliL family protein [Actinokineospora auranticolor]|uniref:Flagellar protein FliL n=1 Tax=Actinokineospora auranticolor TaxID=155976 RepID=A0A2S6GMM1_9PSEU|nr:flagellar basal body-associated FliL family protein [Actinokineospora auranticolor]PPK66489.1 flagellar FliL protein [Actinokineospora auranticolor]
MSKDEKKKDDAKPEEGGKKSKKKLLLIVALVVLLAGGGGAYFFLFSSSEPAAPKPGTVVALDAITVNLTDGHYLKLKLALQATADVTEKLDGSKALDLAVTQFSNRTVAELSSNETREAQKTELQEKIGKAYDEEVMGIYFTEFVMQ